jgi:hypothetical protein
VEPKFAANSAARSFKALGRRVTPPHGNDGPAPPFKPWPEPAEPRPNGFGSTMPGRQPCMIADPCQRSKGRPCSPPSGKRGNWRRRRRRCPAAPPNTAINNPENNSSSKIEVLLMSYSHPKPIAATGRWNWNGAARWCASGGPRRQAHRREHRLVTFLKENIYAKARIVGHGALRCVAGLYCRIAQRQSARLPPNRVGVAARHS